MAMLVGYLTRSRGNTPCKGFLELSFQKKCFIQTLYVSKFFFCNHDILYQNSSLIDYEPHFVNYFINPFFCIFLILLKRSFLHIINLLAMNLEKNLTNILIKFILHILNFIYIFIQQLFHNITIDTYIIKINRNKQNILRR